MSDPPEFTLKEYPSKAAVDFLLANLDVLDMYDANCRRKLKDLQQTDARLTEVQRIQLSSPSLRLRFQGYAAEFYKNGFVEVSYKYTRVAKTMGRMFAAGLSMQNMPSALRQHLSYEDHADLDFSNAAFTIIAQLCKKNEIPCPHIDEYVLNREDVLDRIKSSIEDSTDNEGAVTRACVKTLLLKILFGGRNIIQLTGGQLIDVDDISVMNLQTECRKVHVALAALPELAEELAIKREQHANTDAMGTVNAKACALKVFRVENICVNSLRVYSSSKAFKPDTSQFDGLQVLLGGRELDDRFSESATAYIEEKTGFRLPIVRKPIPAPDLQLILQQAAQFRADIDAKLHEMAAETEDVRKELSRVKSFVGVKNAFILIEAPMNGGKTYRTIEFIKPFYDAGYRIRFITNRKSMAYVLKTATALGMDFFIYLDAPSGEELTHDHIIVQYQSLHRCKGVYDIDVYDEVRSTFDAAQCITTNRDFLSANWDKVLLSAAESKHCLFLDADIRHDDCVPEMLQRLLDHRHKCKLAKLKRLSDAETEQAAFRSKHGMPDTSKGRCREAYAEALLAPPETIYRPPPPARPALERGFLLASSAQIRDMMMDDVQNGRRSIVACGSKKEAKIIFDEMTSNHVKACLYSREYGDPNDFQDLDEMLKGYDWFIFTSVLTTGADIQQAFHRCYLLMCTNAAKPRDSSQKVGRARKLTNTEIVVRCDVPYKNIRVVTKREVQQRVTKFKNVLIKKQGIISRIVQEVKTKLIFTVSQEVIDGEVRFACDDILTMMAYSMMESDYTRSESEQLAYLLYIGRNKGWTERLMIDPQIDMEIANKQEKLRQGELTAGEAVRRAQEFEALSLAGIPLYSLREQEEARVRLHQLTREQYEEAEKVVEMICEGDLTLANAQLVEEEAASNDAVNRYVTYNLISQKAREVDKICRLERMNTNSVKSAFLLSRSAESGQDFTDYHLTLLCKKLKYKILYPQVQNITLAAVTLHEKYKQTIKRYLRLKADGGQVVMSSYADFLSTAVQSHCLDHDYLPHITIDQCTQMAKALGFKSALDFVTEIPEQDFTKPKIERFLNMLENFGISSRSDKITAEVTNALKAVLGVQLKRVRKRKNRNGETADKLKLVLCDTMDTILKMNEGMSTEHWYKQQYGMSPPIQDELRPRTVAQLTKVLTAIEHSSNPLWLAHVDELRNQLQIAT